MSTPVIWALVVITSPVWFPLGLVLLVKILAWLGGGQR